MNTVRPVGSATQASACVQLAGVAQFGAAFANYLKLYATQMHLVRDQRLVAVLADAAGGLKTILGDKLRGVLLGGSYSLGLERPGSDVDYFVYLDTQASEMVGKVKTLVDEKLLNAGYRICPRTQGTTRNIRLLPEVSDIKTKLPHASEFVLAPIYNFPIYGDMIDLRLAAIHAYRQSLELESILPSYVFNSTRSMFLCLGADAIARRFVSTFSEREGFAEDLGEEAFYDLVRLAVPFTAQRDNRFPLPKELDCLLKTAADHSRIFSVVRQDAK